MCTVIQVICMHICVSSCRIFTPRYKKSRITTYDYVSMEIFKSNIPEIANSPPTMTTNDEKPQHSEIRFIRRIFSKPDTKTKLMLLFILALFGISFTVWILSKFSVLYFRIYAFFSYRLNSLKLFTVSLLY